MVQGRGVRHFLSMRDLSNEELWRSLHLAAELKEKQRRGEPHQLLRGRTLAMIFFKASTRTRVSFETGMYQLGGQAIYLNSRDIQLSRGETMADTARVLSRYVDGITVRAHDHALLEELAAAATVPVINGLTNLCHPCQALADLLTLWEIKGRLEGLKLAYIGDGNNMAHSLMLAGIKAGLEVAVATPPGYEPDPRVVSWAREEMASGTGTLTLTHDPLLAAADADAVYTDVWVSMGQEDQEAERLQRFHGYQVDSLVMSQAKADAVFLHCLPAHRDQEVSGAVLEGPQARVFDQAENRLHAQKALLVLLMAT